MSDDEYDDPNQDILNKASQICVISRFYFTFSADLPTSQNRDITVLIFINYNKFLRSASKTDGHTGSRGS